MVRPGDAGLPDLLPRPLAAARPLLVAATLRDDDGLDDEPELGRTGSADAGHRAGSPSSRSARWTAADTARLAEAIRGGPLPDAGPRLLQAATGGFPLYVVEAVRAAGGPARVAAGRRPRTPCCATGSSRRARPPGRWPASPRRSAATSPSTCSPRPATSTPTPSSQAVDELWRRRILRELGDGYDFSHDLLRDAAYARVSPPRRWLLHRRIAQGLELLHADDTDPVAAQLAEQYARGGRPDRAVAYYRRAADVAAGVFAHAEAIRLHRAALSIVRALPAGPRPRRPGARVLEAMAAPLTPGTATPPRTCRRRSSASIALAESLGRDGLAAQRPGRALGLAGSSRAHRRRHRTATRALALVEPGSELSGAAHFAVGGSALSLGTPAEALRHLELAAALATGTLC